MDTQVLSLTRNLLKSGAFNHLSMRDMVRLERLLMAKQEFNRTEQLMQFWYNGNYFTLRMPQHLLHDCNMLLMHAGKPMIDVFVEDVFEA